jgi:LysM domain-containing protein
LEGEPEQPERRSLTPAVLASALFLAACATFAVTFVAARGGLTLPIGATAPPVALASPEPTVLVTPAPLPSTEPTIEATVEPTQTAIPTAPATVAPTSVPPFALPPLKPGDPLLALDKCPGHPLCFVYVVQRNDTMIRIVARYDLDEDVVLALNPKITDPRVVVVGQTMYLGRDRFVRLDPCPNGERCFLYKVVQGDSVSDIAARYAISADAIRAANPTMPRPIVPGLILKLPYPG